MAISSPTVDRLFEIRTRGRAWLIAALLVVVASACGGESTEAPSTTTTSTTAAPITVLDRLAETGRHTELLRLIDAAGLDETLRSGGPFTLFAPTDAAFAALDASERAELEGDLLRVRDAILYHAIVGIINAGDVTDAGFATTMAGFNVDLRPGGSSFEVNGVAVVSGDDQADNGVIHEIDRVLRIPTVGDVLGQSTEFTNFLVAVEATGLVTELRSEGPVTLLVPINAGYEPADLERLNELAEDPAALERYVRYHLIEERIALEGVREPFVVTTAAGIDIEFAPNDQGLWTAGGITIVNANVPASNGGIHVLDRVLYPPPGEGEGE